MMVGSRCIVSLVTLTILAATLTWINSINSHSSSGLFRKIELNNGNEGRRLQFLDLSCWIAGEPLGCNTPAPTKAPTPIPTPPLVPLDSSLLQAPTNKPTTLKPSTSSNTAPSTPKPTPTVVPNNYSVIKWDSGGYCTNSIPSTPGFGYTTKTDCCKSFASGSQEKLNKCLSFEAVQLDACTGLNKDSCDASPVCNFDLDQNDCKMMCEGRDKDHCRKRHECLYLPLKNFCTMTEEQYQLASIYKCTLQTSKTLCGKYPNCAWNHYANKRKGECQSLCGRVGNERKCTEFEECEWNEKAEMCSFSQTDIFNRASDDCKIITKKDKCKANLPRCRWQDNKSKCLNACEPLVEESNCSTRYCTWDIRFGCLPRYVGFCETLNEMQCVEPLQCMLKSENRCISRCRANDKSQCDKNTACWWELGTKVCRYNHDLDTKKNSGRFVRGNLFER